MDQEAPYLTAAWRRNFLKRPDLFETAAVPLVLYGPEVLSGTALPPEAAGSHIDIGPTLVELIAPQGFLYHSMGKDLLDPQQRPFGISRDRIIGPDFIADLRGSPRVCPLHGIDPLTDMPDSAQLKRLHDAIHGIAWWRIMRGPQL